MNLTRICMNVLCEDARASPIGSSTLWRLFSLFSCACRNSAEKPKDRWRGCTRVTERLGRGFPACCNYGQAKVVSKEKKKIFKSGGQPFWRPLPVYLCQVLNHFAAPQLRGTGYKVVWPYSFRVTPFPDPPSPASLSSCGPHALIHFH